MMKRVLAVVLAAMLVLGLLGGCQRVPAGENKPENKSADQSETVAVEDDMAAEAIPVKLAVPAGVTTVSILPLMEEPAQLGLEIDVEILSGPDMIAPTVINEKADAVLLPTNLASVLMNKNVPYKIAGASIWGTLYVVSTEDISEWRDLSGGSITTFGRGLTPDVLLQYLLEENGVDPAADVDITYLAGGADVAPAFLSGQTKTAVMPEPMLTTVLAKSENAKVVLDFQEEWQRVTKSDGSYPQAVWVLRDGFSEEHPEAAAALMRALEESAQWVNGHPKDTGELAVKHDIGLPAAIVEQSIERSNIHFVQGASSKSEIEAYLEVLKKSSPKLIGGDLPNAEKYYEE